MPDIETARTWYQDADAIHDFEHVLRVYHVSDRLAREEGADIEIVNAAALLHDSRGTLPGSDERKEHHLASALFAGEVLTAEGWQADRIAAVQHCIRAHRYRSGGETPETLEAMCIYDADKLDVLGAIGAVRTVGYALLAGQPAYAEPSEHFITTMEKEPGEPHSAYHEWLFKLRNVRERMFTKAARRIADERHAYLEEFFRRLGAEMRGEM